MSSHTTDNFNAIYKDYLKEIEAVLPVFLSDGSDNPDDTVLTAANYSLTAGGKRIRPVLLLAAARMLSADYSCAQAMSAAVEMIHTYSLIHDDLPCMDDDELRRGRPTCHVVYGEAIAVLAGDALLNRAYEILLNSIDLSAPGSLKAARYIASSAGLSGMIAGQSLDLNSEGRKISMDELRNLHRHKTGALISAPLVSAALLAEADQKIIDYVSEYADAIGLAFQIQDDILDVTAQQIELGKTVGKDARDQKSTYVSLLGLEEARNQLRETDKRARIALASLKKEGLDISFLSGMTDFLLVRTW
ncbi:MAG: polyprenyl synthetase family protein [Eubacteriales bacterium]|nr:polyprenyl synthetase family protein [Eubacteriales bacterium]MDD4681568.1 polyprenyl synthetase family protein [Eubacteriales bacterium]